MYFQPHFLDAKRHIVSLFNYHETLTELQCLGSRGCRPMRFELAGGWWHWPMRFELAGGWRCWACLGFSLLALPAGGGERPDWLSAGPAAVDAELAQPMARSECHDSLWPPARDKETQRFKRRIILHTWHLKSWLHTEKGMAGFYFSLRSHLPEYWFGFCQFFASGFCQSSVICPRQCQISNNI